MVNQERIKHVADAIESRRSVRAFKPDAVPKETIEHILAAASRAPSGNNIQPWNVMLKRVFQTK